MRRDEYGMSSLAPNRMQQKGSPVLAELISGVVGALIGIVGTILVEQRQAAAKAAYDACFALQEALADWMNEIATATREEGNAPAVLRRLLTVFEQEKYQRRVGEYISRLEGQADSANLARLSNVFTRQAFESKGRTAMALIAGEFGRDYNRHRDDALDALRRVFTDFDMEVKKVGTELKRKAGL
jgi:hypothetical protein